MLRKTVLQGTFIFVLIFFPALTFSMGFKENELKGNSFYRDGDFEGASLEYSEGLTRKADYDLYYNRGVSYYKLGQYDKSYSDFENAATYANSGREQIKAVYNAGNSNFLMAETVKTKSPDKAIEFYGQAVKHFERVLELDLDNPDASYNLELSRLRLDEIEQESSDDQNGDESEDGQQDGDSQDEQDQNGEQSMQNQNEGDQPEGDDHESEQMQQQNSNNSESSYLSEEITPKDILNEEARRQEAIQFLKTNDSGAFVDKDW